jgi:hypothetical protein
MRFAVRCCCSERPFDAGLPDEAELIDNSGRRSESPDPDLLIQACRIGSAVRWRAACRNSHEAKDLRRFFASFFEGVRACRETLTFAATRSRDL